MSNEEKMLDEFEMYWYSSKVVNPHLITEHSMRFAREAWKACAAIKDAEIAAMKQDCTLLADKLASLQSHTDGEIMEARVEIAARDLMIKELREAVQHAQKQPYPFGHLELFDKALAKSEHYNPRALEKKLLEARIEELEDLGNTIGFGSTTFLSRIAERKSKYELL